MMNFNQPQDNNPLSGFMRQPKIYIKLPSGGAFWPRSSIDIPETGDLAVYSMTAKDEITFKTPDALLNGQAVVDVIHSCIPVQSNTQGNLDWHVLRAMHLAGRCISCGECGRACPVNIPCHLLTMQLADQTYNYFKVHAGTSQDMKSVMSTFEPNDKESFII